MTSKVTIKDVTKGLAIQLLQNFKHSIPETELFDIAIKITYALVKAGLDLSTLKALSNIYHNPEAFKSLLLSKLGNSISITTTPTTTPQLSISSQNSEVPDFIKDNPWVSILQNRSR